MEHDAYETFEPGAELPADRPAKTTEPDDDLGRFACQLAREMADGRCTDVIVIDVRTLSDVTHYILIGSGTSDRQIKSVARDLTDFALEHGHERYGGHSDDASTWIVADFVDAMVHLFEPSTRSHYDLEMMWGDAPRLDWETSAPAKPRDVPGQDPANA